MKLLITSNDNASGFGWMLNSGQWDNNFSPFLMSLWLRWGMKRNRSLWTCVWSWEHISIPLLCRSIEPGSARYSDLIPCPTLCNGPSSPLIRFICVWQQDTQEQFAVLFRSVGSIPLWVHVIYVSFFSSLSHYCFTFALILLPLHLPNFPQCSPLMWVQSVMWTLPQASPSWVSPAISVLHVTRQCFLHFTPQQ